MSEGRHRDAYTDEQKAILNLAEGPMVTANGRVVRIVAGAGTGKTTTLQAFAERLQQHGHVTITYLTFNRTAAADCAARLRGVDCRTFHSQAMKSLELPQKITLGAENEVDELILETFERDIERMLQRIDKTHQNGLYRAERTRLAFFIRRTLDRFTASADSLELGFSSSVWGKTYYPAVKHHREARHLDANVGDFYTSAARRLYELLLPGKDGKSQADRDRDRDRRRARPPARGPAPPPPREAAGASARSPAIMGAAQAKLEEALGKLAAADPRGDGRAENDQRERADEAGAEDDAGLAQYKDPEFHARLREDWPEDGDQLHSGGWEMTKKLMRDIEAWLRDDGVAATEARLLDLCCGEGSTPIYFAKERGWANVGIDISESAVKAAGEAAKRAGVEERAIFVAGSAFELPFEAGSFDVIYGQDPDALSLPQRPACFRDCMKTLRRGGVLVFHHHWIPGRGWDEATLRQYCQESGSDNVHADLYVRDLEAAGFVLEQVEDISALASSHLHGQLANMRARVANKGGVVQPWLVKTCEYMDNGHPFGVRVVARKP